MLHGAKRRPRRETACPRLSRQPPSRRPPVDALLAHSSTSFPPPPLPALQTEDYLGRLEAFAKCDDLNAAAKTTLVKVAEEDAWFTQEVARQLQSTIEAVKVHASLPASALIRLHFFFRVVPPPIRRRHGRLQATKTPASPHCLTAPASPPLPPPRRRPRGSRARTRRCAASRPTWTRASSTMARWSTITSASSANRTRSCSGSSRS